MGKSLSNNKSIENIFPTIKEVEIRLASLGFRRLGFLYSEKDFGNFVINYTNDDILIRIIRDRGQIFVEARGQNKQWIYVPKALQINDISTPPRLHVVIDEIFNKFQILTNLVSKA